MTSGHQEFHYRLPGKPGGQIPGMHGSRSRGTGADFAAHGRLFDYPDPRRLDLRASLASVPREWLVRVHRQRSSVSIQAIVDVSASMHVGRPSNKLDVAQRFLQALGHSAFRVGDRVGLSGFDQRACARPFLPARSGRGLGVQLSDELASLDALDARPGDGQGLLECARALTGREALVFIVSDFHWPLTPLTAVFERLSGTLVVPVVLQDAAELQTPVGTGWMQLADAESGRTRSVWLNDRARRRWQQRLADRNDAVASAFASAQLRPLHLSDGFDADVITRYFIEATA